MEAPLTNNAATQILLKHDQLLRHAIPCYELMETKG